MESGTLTEAIVISKETLMKSYLTATPCLLSSLLALLLSQTITASLFADNDTHARGIVADKPNEGRFVESAAGYMVPYSETIPGTNIVFEMVPIPGGRFKMGSPESEEGRSTSEGPQFEVDVPPFWIGKYEVTWSEYKLFMDLYTTFKDIQSLRTKVADPTISRLLADFGALKRHLDVDVNDVDGITVPTPLYDPSITFEHGENPRQPAATMTQYAAKQYTKWLTRLLGNDYRLPSEAEWEYASRAGTNTVYFFGDDAEQLGEFAWYYENSDEKTHQVGEKKPNPWGLYDVYGNVAEWTVDAFSEDGYDQVEANKTQTLAEAIHWPTEPFPCSVRGGHWDDDAEQCRSASRLGSDDYEWKSEDPNIPLSPWWLASYPSSGVGFRLLRPLKPLTDEQKKKFWEAHADELVQDVQGRLEEGRGVKDNVNHRLPETVEQLKAFSEKQ
jgi:formylglycine-generating enzyme required for sulfatase activity